MKIIDGKKIANDLQNQIKKKIIEWQKIPKLVVILVGENEASKVYVRNKAAQAKNVGIESHVISLPANTSEAELLNNINILNQDNSVNGILVQLPLPKHIDQLCVIDTIDPKKDVDCFHTINVGNLVIGKQQSFLPCTPHGCLYLIKSVLGNNLKGLNSLVIGRSNIVGKPMSNLLLQEDCTVTIAHSKTDNIEEKCLQADIIVAAVGKPRLVRWTKAHAVVIDVGISKVNGKLTGDIDWNAISKTAQAATPVPGGVGPMTITFLLANTLLAQCWQDGVSISIMDILSI